ncbi:hypothetical protein [Photobacterium kishitanii]|uniref:Uncharacterized protein n=1 Tax=Photobacterium kishitanii TaxID=318456 RepID=A0A2T3KLP0_9GAMM|nr:hypothetical protein [Photobacterium kishitanii]PSV00557.1 hypothetical protein C9J27_05325 [Photobacterium kishitanii]
MCDRVTIAQIKNTELYEIFLDGLAEEHEIKVPSLDRLSPEKAKHIAERIANETSSELSWEGYKPAWL